jgi:hypothetical protein
LIEATYADFLAQFTAIETERRTLSKDLQNSRSELSATRRSGPKRYWRSARKERFEQERTAAISRLGTEVGELEKSLDNLAVRRRALDEKEKFSYQSLDYLLKLANFVEFIEADGFWAAQIVQIDIRGGAESSDTWREPELVLIPRAGDHRILLGRLDGGEAERLEKLRRFYLEGLWHEGWNRFAQIDIRYRDQVVCTE